MMVLQKSVYFISDIFFGFTGNNGQLFKTLDGQSDRFGLVAVHLASSLAIALNPRR